MPNLCCYLHAVPCVEREVRLTGGYGASERNGEVQVCVNRMWGSVCSRPWDSAAASVVCRELGFSPYGLILKHCWIWSLIHSVCTIGSFALTDSYYYRDSWPTIMFNVNCSGAESSIWECAHTLQGSCGLYEDAIVICQSMPIIIILPS